VAGKSLRTEESTSTLLSNDAVNLKICGDAVEKKHYLHESISTGEFMKLS